MSNSKYIIHSYQMLLSSGVFSTFETIWAPWMGGLEYIGRIRILIWDITRACSSLSLHTTVNAPALSPGRQFAFYFVPQLSETFPTKNEGLQHLLNIQTILLVFIFSGKSRSLTISSLMRKIFRQKTMLASLCKSIPSSKHQNNHGMIQPPHKYDHSAF